MKCKLNLLLTAALLVFAFPMPASAAIRGCSFKKSVQKSGLNFDITSRPAIGCAVQIIEISIGHGGKIFSRYRTDVDYLAENAWAADLNGDGKPELVVASRTVGNEARGALDVYQVDGKTVRRASLPELTDPSGYRGGDRFGLDGRQIVRTVPVYRDGDLAGEPTGGSRVLIYDFNAGRISFREQLDQQPEQFQALNRSAAGQTSVTSEAGKLHRPLIKEIAVTGTVIEIMADAPIGKFRTIKLEKPERIAIDIPSASSPLAGKRIKIEKSGISRARIGLNRGFLRIVLDSTLAVFPKHSITTSDHGLKIVFGDE